MVENSLIDKTKYKINYDKVNSEINHLKKTLDIKDEIILSNGGYQVSLVHRKNVNGLQRYSDGIHNLWNDKEDRKESWEHEFTEFNKDLENSYLHQIYKDVQNLCENKAHRMRLMWLAPKSNYAVHKDSYEPNRYHYVVETNPYCFFVYDINGELVIKKIPKDGYLYKVNAGVPHSFVNAGKTIRLHLLITTSETDQ